MHHDIPTVLNTPHGTEHPHGTETPHGTAHTLYRVFNRDIRLLLKQEKEIKDRLKISKSKSVQKGREKDLKVLSKTISKRIAQFNWELVTGSISNGLISKEDFWKVKKKHFPKISSNPSLDIGSKWECFDRFSKYHSRILQ